MNILFYGNCQIGAVKETLNCPNSTLIYCWNTNITKEEFVSILQNSDVIITQPISDNYQKKDYLSTSFILKNTKAKVILFDSCHFDFYYFDLTYHFVNDKILKEPGDYHYKTILKTYKSFQECIDTIHSPLKTKDELEKMAEDSLNEMKRRRLVNEKYDVHMISIHDFVKQNYKDKLLFYSMNHPTKYVIQYICEEIINHLKWENTINYDKDVLTDVKCILYPCVQAAVHFDISEYPPFFKGKKNIHDIVGLYCDTYSGLGI